MRQRPARHHRLIIDSLEKLYSGDFDRLMICCPPGSAKSTYASKLAPAWFLAQRPYLQIIGASHTTGLAETVSRDVQNFVRDNESILGYGLKTENVKRWTTTNGGQYMASGVGSSIAGFRADIAIIDDPVANREDADSEILREKAWRWFLADLLPRSKPSVKIVLIMTRWHEDDLGGRLLQADEGDNRWHVLKLPAIAGEDDPLGRKPGEWLWDNDAEYEYAATLRDHYAYYQKTGGMREWYALFQQNPRPLEGSLFKPNYIETIPTSPAGGKVVRAWDLAATEKLGSRDPDYTTGVKLARMDDGFYVVQDIVRIQGGPDEVERTIVNTAKQDGRGVTIGLPQDPGQAGKTQVLYLTRKLAGYKVQSSTESGDKGTRAAPVASQVNVGNVKMVKAVWNAAFIDELRSFPAASHDDQADALSRAFGMLIAPPAPAYRARVKIGMR